MSSMSEDSQVHEGEDDNERAQGDAYRDPEGERTAAERLAERLQRMESV